jgi:hypothetical protein
MGSPHSKGGRKPFKRNPMESTDSRRFQDFLEFAFEAERWGFKSLQAPDFSSISPGLTHEPKPTKAAADSSEKC